MQVTTGVVSIYEQRTRGRLPFSKLAMQLCAISSFCITVFYCQSAQLCLPGIILKTILDFNSLNICQLALLSVSINMLLTILISLTIMFEYILSTKLKQEMICVMQFLSLLSTVLTILSLTQDLIFKIRILEFASVLTLISIIFSIICIYTLKHTTRQ